MEGEWRKKLIVLDRLLMKIGELKRLEVFIEEMKDLARFEAINHELNSICLTLKEINSNIPLFKLTRQRVQNTIKRLMERQSELMDRNGQREAKERAALQRRIIVLEKTSEDDLKFALIISKVLIFDSFPNFL